MLIPGIHAMVVLADALAGFTMLVPGIQMVGQMLWQGSPCWSLESKWSDRCFGRVHHVGPWNPNCRAGRCFGRVHSVGPSNLMVSGRHFGRVHYVGPWNLNGRTGRCFGSVHHVGPWNPNGRTDRCFGTGFTMLVPGFLLAWLPTFSCRYYRVTGVEAPVIFLLTDGAPVPSILYTVV